MRYLALSLLVYSFALAPEADAQLAAGSGVYLGLGGGYSHNAGIVGPALAAGYRQQNGLEYGIGLSFDNRPGSERYS